MVFLQVLFFFDIFRLSQVYSSKKNISGGYSLETDPMKIRTSNINILLLSIVFFFTFLGFYFVLTILMNLGMAETTRLVTIPIRILICVCLIFLTVTNVKNLNFNSSSKWFLLFIVCYLVRITYDYSINRPYFIEYSDLIFYTISFCIIPFFSIVTFKFDKKYLTRVVLSLLFSGLLFSVFSTISYGRFVGEVERLGSNIVEEDVLSPLILSYCGTLVLGITSIYLIYNKTGILTKIFCLVAIALSVIPFFLGASRGSLFSLFVPFVFLLLSKQNLKSSIQIIFSIIGLSVILMYLDKSLGSGLLERFFEIGDDVEQGTSAASRLSIWSTSFNQFLNNPFFGDQLKTDNIEIYPHNIFIEVLQTVGFIVFIPFSVIIYRCLKVSHIIFKYYHQYSWISVLFLQALMYHMFSGSIYNAAWLWTSAALVLATGSYLSQKSRIYD